jgi:hypothetical protein
MEQGAAGLSPNRESNPNPRRYECDEENVFPQKRAGADCSIITPFRRRSSCLRLDPGKVDIIDAAILGADFGLQVLQ